MKRGCFLSSPNKSTAYCRFAGSASGLNFSLQQQSSAAVATRRGVQAEEQQRPLRRPPRYVRGVRRHRRVTRRR